MAVHLAEADVASGPLREGIFAERSRRDVCLFSRWEILARGVLWSAIYDDRNDQVRDLPGTTVINQGGTVVVYGIIGE